MREYKLTKWGLCSTDSPYSSPESISKRLFGLVDNTEVVTSRIVEVNGRRVSTLNSIYILDGDPCEDYLNWMLENDFAYDKDNPISVKSFITKFKKNEM